MKKIAFILFIFTLLSCGTDKEKSDAYGNFEADEILISAETAGKILEFNIENGQKLNVGDRVAVIDTVFLMLQRKQLYAHREAIASKTSGILAQIAVQTEQLSILKSERKRVENLVKDGAAPQKQLDDIVNNISVVEKQINSVETQNASVLGEIKALDAQIELLNEQIKRSVILNPVQGTVLEHYAKAGEMANAGKVLYKIASIDELNLKAYISGKQLNEVKLGNEVTVLIDAAEGNLLKYKGKVIWISDNAEFTPKVIQTREERVNLVYAIKIKVKNDGKLKIGMPAEMKISEN